jgi:hypothetical protein
MDQKQIGMHDLRIGINYTTVDDYTWQDIINVYNLLVDAFSVLRNHLLCEMDNQINSPRPMLSFWVI